MMGWAMFDVSLDEAAARREADPAFGLLLGPASGAASLEHVSGALQACPLDQQL